MGFFSRRSNDTPANPQMAELGREYAIAQRHGDRKTVRHINRQIGETGMNGDDRASFEQGRAAYDALPPVNPPRRRNRRS